MTDFVIRNQFRLPVNAVEVGLRWGRDGYTCEPHRADACRLENAAAIPSGFQTNAAQARKAERMPAQAAMSKGFFGFQSPARPPLRKPVIATVLEPRPRGEDLIAVALSGGLTAIVEGQVIDLFPGDELRVPRGLECELGVTAMTTRWLHGFRR